MLSRELEYAVGLAREAGKVILSHYAGDIIAEEKIGVDCQSEPVTAADREASRIIVASLSEHFPDDAILSEEEQDDSGGRLEKSRVWIIDPIDGTAGFINKDGDFAVQIGLARDGNPILGVVFLPFHDVLYYAALGEGAFAERNGRTDKLSVSSKHDFRAMNLAVSRNHRSPKISRIVDEFGFDHEISRGSVGLKIGLIAESVCDAYIHLSPRTKFWDTCAPQIILEEAGGRLTDLWGERYRYDVRDVQNWGGIVASNGAAHNEAVARLGPLLAEFGRSRR